MYQVGEETCLAKAAIAEETPTGPRTYRVEVELVRLTLLLLSEGISLLLSRTWLA